MPYIIIRDDGWFVAKAESKHSYTQRLQCARVYPTQTEAEKDVCPRNERIIDVMDAFK